MPMSVSKGQGVLTRRINHLLFILGENHDKGTPINPPFEEKTHSEYISERQEKIEQAITAIEEARNSSEKAVETYEATRKELQPDANTAAKEELQHTIDKITENALDHLQEAERCLLILSGLRPILDRVERQLCNRHSTTETEDAFVFHANSMHFMNAQILAGEAKVRNPRKHKLEPVHVMLDTRSDRSFITKELADRLQLQNIDSTDFIIHTFASQNPITMACEMATLPLWNADGTSHNVTVTKTETITKPLKRRCISQEDRRFLSESKVELSINPDITEIQPEVLLGCSDLYYLLDGEGYLVKTLPSGLKLIPSKLGYLVSGSDINRLEDSHNIGHLTRTVKEMHDSAQSGKHFRTSKSSATQSEIRSSQEQFKEPLLQSEILKEEFDTAYQMHSEPEEEVDTAYQLDSERENHLHESQRSNIYEHDVEETDTMKSEVQQPVSVEEEFNETNEVIAFNEEMKVQRDNTPQNEVCMVTASLTSERNEPSLRQEDPILPQNETVSHDVVRPVSANTSVARTRNQEGATTNRTASYARWQKPIDGNSFDSEKHPTSKVLRRVVHATEELEKLHANPSILNPLPLQEQDAIYDDANNRDSNADEQNQIAATQRRYNLRPRSKATATPYTTQALIPG